MKAEKYLQQMVVITLVLALLVGCAQATAEPPTATAMATKDRGPEETATAQAIEAATEGESNLDEVLRRLCDERGLVTSERFRRIAEEVAGRELPAFARREVPRAARTAGASPP